MSPADEPRLLKRIVELASDYGRYGYRRVTALLRREGWTVNHKRVERLWRQEGPESPAEAAETEAIVAGRRLVRPAAASLQGSRLELRLRRRPHERRPSDSDANTDRRAHAASA